MAIPSFNDYGLLPDGIHECTLQEAAGRFGTFQGNDRRPELWGKFAAFMREAKAYGLIDAVLVDGSFATAEPAPNDIDLVLVVPASHDFSAALPPNQYNLLAQRRVRIRFGFDIVVVKDGSDNLVQAVAFFRQVKQRPGVRKGILRIKL